MQVDITIIGAGPSGLAAAIQLKRYGFAPLLLERQASGGLLRNANLVENYPGFPAGITGLKLVQRFERHAQQVGVQVTLQEVVELTYDGHIFQVHTTKQTYSSGVLVIASGTKPRLLDDFAIPDYLQDRIYYEVHSLLEIKGKRFAIIGAGDAAFDYALNLSRNNEVIILNRGEQIKCLPLLWERACTSPRITYQPSVCVTSLEITHSDGIVLEYQSPSGSSQIYADYLIGAIGRDPQLDFVANTLLLHRQDLEKQGVLYFIGDVTNGLFRQTSIAVGQGVMAAMKIYQHLEEKLA